MDDGQQNRTAGGPVAAAALSDEAAAWVALHALGVSGRMAPRVHEAGGPCAVLASGPETVAPLLQGRGRRPPDDFAAALGRARGWAKQVERFAESGGAVLAPSGASSRGRLGRAPAPPLCAYARGPVALLEARPLVAIVGTRAPSLRGARRARTIGRALAQAGAVVCSGGALGIDLAAHQGALEAGGATLVVLGDPLKPGGDERPERVRALEGEVLSLTAHGPWVPMARTLFVSRNRLVAALADALVVIEAAHRSGTRHTVEAAARLGVPLFVVPGDPEDALAATPNQLIFEGRARPLLDVTYLLETLGLGPEGPSVAPTEEAPPVDAQPPLEGSLAQRLLVALERAEGGLAIDELTVALAAPIPALLSEVFALELRGRVRQEGGRLSLVGPRRWAGPAPAGPR